MSRLDDLIAELCPDGVEYKPLGEVVRFKNGRDHKSLDAGTIPVYGSGGIMRYVNNATGTGPSVLVPRKGSLGNLFYVEGDFWTVDTIFSTEINTKQINARFLYHQLLTMNLGAMNNAGGVPSQTQSALNQLVVPLPPLEVQEEIVRILDTFSELTAELTAELILRKKQYEYYRDALIAMFDPETGAPIPVLADLLAAEGIHDPKDITRVLLKDLEAGGVLTLGRGKVISKTDIAASPGDYPVYSSSASGTGEFGQYGQYMFDDERISWSIDGGGRFYYRSKHRYSVTNVSGWLQVNQPNAFSTKYLFYILDYLWSFEQFDYTRKAHPSVIRDLYEIPLLSLATQEAIVRILDDFSAVTTSMTEGLPAEIALRQKQYEYFREQLLTFKRLEVAA